MWPFYTLAAFAGALFGGITLIQLFEWRWDIFGTFLGFAVLGFLGLGWYVFSSVRFG